MQLLVGSLVRVLLGHAQLAEPGPQTTSREIKTGTMVQTHREPAPPSAFRTSPVLSVGFLLCLHHAWCLLAPTHSFPPLPSQLLLWPLVTQVGIF